MAASLAQGFQDPVFEAQAAFRTIMAALARPGTLQPLKGSLQPPPALPAGLAAAALTLADHEAPLWLDPALAVDAEVAAYLRFYTGAAIVAAPDKAAFALVAEPARCPPLERFAPGTLEYPDRSTTLILAVDSLTEGPSLTLVGPGIEGRATLAARPLPEGFLEQWAANTALFPRGVDLLLTDGAALVGLPRTTRIAQGG
ncbi:MAG TPA: phosphonate C-P lyase system protein PhnH [Microvirga sp.]|jgi:alpha-D-ribose 1-methylphosphonate 5-triphosphate synthase subunit PhnH|nr:phosphonate C-P lyase system protein PhnH [Microvirga sp.]